MAAKENFFHRFLTGAGPKRPLRVLSLDGGGDKCLSAVQILYELFRKLQESGSTQEQPKPCDYLTLSADQNGVLSLP